MKYVYPACFYREDDGRYSVELPDFSIATFGDDIADAMYMAADAAAGRILAMLECGDKLPYPTNPNNVKLENAHIGCDCFVSMIYIDMDSLEENFVDKPVKKTLTIPSWLNRAAERKNVNFSAILKDALIEKIAN
ncbi:HicB family protein [Spirochaetia bacterium]|nr:HicB family protein [Spirochaetia bacterium]GHV20864.1 HicB family protein [Spirochaetia bacterium]